MTNVPDGGSIVRVLDGTGRAAGVGVLLGPRQIVTCAHVVNIGLGRAPRAQDQPDSEVSVEFAVGDGPVLRARVQRWLPPPRTGVVGDDVAGLMLTGTEFPAGVTPARLAATPPVRGQVVDVFGYPQHPPRPDGAWVDAIIRGPVRGGLLQLDSPVDTALRIQPGFSGSPVYDRNTGRVLGLVAATSRELDSYAITADRLRLAWPEALDPRPAQARERTGGKIGELTILHVSDPQFGRHHLFGGNGLTPADQTHDTLFQRLHDDLDALAENHGLRPDLLVVTGDLAEGGLRSEFQQVGKFLTALTEAVELPRRHVVLVPGNHDVNRNACAAYFQSEEADECEPVAPYWPKWRHFTAAFEQFYDGVEGVSFTPDEPWTLFEMPDLAVVVAGLNSTMAESHLDTDHYGWLGEHQLRWFAQRLARYRDQGWLRLAAVHHNAVRGAISDDENLRDARELDHWLGQPGLVNLLLHGHTHDGQLHRLSSGLLALSTGSAAVTAAARPHEVPNQYQLLTVRPDGVTRHTRQYAVGQRRWIGDTRISHNGSDWHHHEPHRLRHVHTTFPDGRGEPAPEKTAITDSGLLWNFFISYTKSDKAWAEWIAWELDQAGYKIITQTWNMVPGSNWVVMMEEAITHSERTIAVLSHSYLHSVYGKGEWQAAYHADPSGFTRKLIPVRIADCPRPGLLAPIVSIDLFNLGSEAGTRVELLKGIRAAVAGHDKPSTAPDFPEPSGTPTRTPGVQAPPEDKPSFPGG